MIVTSLKRRFFGCIVTSYTSSNDQLADNLTKSLRDSRVELFVTSLVHKIYMHQFVGES